MKNALIITAVCLLTLGVVIVGVAFLSSGFDITKLGTKKFEEKTYMPDGDFDSIEIDVFTSDIDLKPSEDGKFKVVALENDALPTSVKIENGKLLISTTDNRKWYDHINLFGFTSPRVTVFLPDAAYESLNVEASTGDITLPDSFRFKNVSVKLSTGDVEIASNISESLSVKSSTGSITVSGTAGRSITLTASTGRITLSSSSASDNITLEATTGDVRLKDISCNGLTVETTTGDIKIEGARCNNLSATLDTGDISLCDVIAAFNLKTKTDTGDVDLEGCDSENIDITTDTGDVEGSLITGKQFDAVSDTGKVRIPSSSGEGICKIRTDTGDIKITVN